MKAILKAYNTKQRYDDDLPSNEQMTGSIKEALSVARSHVAKKRNTKNFIGFKIFSIDGELKHKLPAW